MPAGNEDGIVSETAATAWLFRNVPFDRPFEDGFSTIRCDDRNDRTETRGTLGKGDITQLTQ